MNRDHSQLKLLLDDYLDRALDEDAAREVALHLESCAECAAEVEETRELLARARALPEAVEPPRDLWDGIRSRIAEPEADRGKVIALRLHRPGGAMRDGSWMRRAAAAAALVVLSSGATAYWLKRGGTAEQVALAPVSVGAPTSPVRDPDPATTRPAVETAKPESPSPSPQPTVRTVARRVEPGPAAASQRPVGALAAFRQSEGTVETLRSEYERRRSTLSPETVAIIEKNLEIMDHAIAEARAALAKDPSNPDLPLLLSGVYRQKAELLQDAVSLQSRS